MCMEKNALVQNILRNVSRSLPLTEERNKECPLPLRVWISRPLKRGIECRSTLAGCWRKENIWVNLSVPRNLTQVKEIVVRTDRLQNESQQMFALCNQGKEEKRLNDWLES